MRTPLAHAVRSNALTQSRSLRATQVHLHLCVKRTPAQQRIRARINCTRADARAAARAAADGSLIYRQLGPSAEQEFSKTWGVGYALDNVRSCACVRLAHVRCAEAAAGAQQASEWQEVLKTAIKAALILVILDMLRITKDRPWFEEHIDFVSVQARAGQEP